MSWRVVVISERAKLDLKLNHMVVRNEKVQKLVLSEISTVIIETTMVSITAALLAELSRRKIKVVFCDEKRNPSSELISYYGCHDTSSKIRNQVLWNEDIKGLLWTEIVKEKIKQQKDFMKKIKLKEWNLLDQYIKEMVFNDETNREGHAAKVYFNAVFGMDFSRSYDCDINSALNYGYGILLSAFNRAIVANGYITQIGLFHNNIYNQFNLSSDLMEPFRPLIDKEVYDMKPKKFEKDEKYRLINVLNKEVVIDNKKYYINNAVQIYCKSVFDAISQKDISQLRFYRNEL